jgi:hypothetical protein
MWRSIAAVIVGYLAMAIPIGLTTAVHMVKVLGKMPQPGQHMDLPVSFGVVNLIYGTLYAVFGGYVCAVIAKQNRMKHGLALAGLVFLLSLVSVYIDRGQQPVWYQVMLVILGAPGAAAGAWIRARRDVSQQSAAGTG